jgi:serine/threonine-protein kinase RsbW
MSPNDQQDRAEVERRLPADGAYVSVVRTTTAGLAARLDFTIDEIEDLRIAIGEACAVVLAEAAAGSDLRCTFALTPGVMTLAVTVATEGRASPDRDSFAWQVLDTLATSAEAVADQGRFTVRLTKQSLLADTEI